MNGLFSSFGFGASIYAEDLPCVTMENAVVAANAFKDNLRMEVLGVEVFGSIARYSEGHDLDLILIVDERMYCQFVDETLTRMQGGCVRRKQHHMITAGRTQDCLPRQRCSAKRSSCAHSKKHRKNSVVQSTSFSSPLTGRTGSLRCNLIFRMKTQSSWSISPVTQNPSVNTVRTPPPPAVHHAHGRFCFGYRLKK